MEDGHGAFPQVLLSEAYLYDEAGRRSYTVDHKGGVIAYAYDAAGRLAAVDYSMMGDGAAVRALDFERMQESGIFAYTDQIDRAMPAVGALSALLYLSVSGSDAARLRAAYDAAAGVGKAGFSTHQQVWRQEFSYDRTGNRTSMTTGWGQIDYSYDEARRMLQSGEKSYSYDAAGNPMTETTGLVTTSYAYNAWSRLNAVTVANRGLSGPDSFAVTYAYDPLGRRVLRDQSSDGPAKDADASSGGGDAAPSHTGARAANARTRFSYQGTTMLIAAERHETSLSLDDLSKPTVEAGGRYRRPTDTAPTSRSFARDVTEYVRAGLTVIGSIDASTGAMHKPTYYVQDILGSIRGSVASAAVDGPGDAGGVRTVGSVGAVGRGATPPRGFTLISYDAFGRPLAGHSTAVDGSPGSSLGSSPNLPTLGYTAKPYDPITAGYDYGFRDYRPDIARFTTIDPIKDGYDWYAYAGHDPVNRVDLWGLDSVYATFDRADQTLSVLYLVNDDRGMLVDVQTYEFNASSNPNPNLVKWTDETGRYQFKPIAFPPGVWELGRPGVSTDPRMLEFVPTNAVGTTIRYDQDQDMAWSENGTATGGGFWIHGGGVNWQSITNGCIRMSNEDVAVFADLVQAAWRTDGNSLLIATEKEQD